MAGLLGSLFGGGNDGGQQGYGLLGALGVPSPGIYSSLNPQMRQFQWQQQLFWNQFNAAKQQFPDMSDAELLTRMQTPNGMEELFTPKQTGEARSASGASAPVYTRGSNIITPNGYGLTYGNNNPQPAGQTTASQNAGGANGPTATPGQGGGAGPLSPADQAGVAYKGAVAEAEAKGKAAGGAAPGFPAALSDAHQKIAQLIAIRDHPNLASVVGRVAGAAPARYSADPDLVSSIDTVDNALRNQTFMGLRTISGRPASAGAIKEMQIGNLTAARTGTVDGFKAEANRLIKQIEDETDAAWVGANSPAEFKPVWGKNEAPQQQQAIPPAGQREIGKIYNTPKGQHKWLGNGWEPVGNASL